MTKCDLGSGAEAQNGRYVNVCFEITCFSAFLHSFASSWCLNL